MRGVDKEIQYLIWSGDFKLNEATFWQLIDETRKASNGDTGIQSELLKDRLIGFDLKEIYEFNEIFDNLMEVAFRTYLWDAVNIITPRCSEDCFRDFRGWLISRGKTTFETVLNDPDSLADIIPGGSEEDVVNAVIDARVLDAPYVAYEQKTGQEIPLATHKASRCAEAHIEQDNLPKRFPRLFAKFANEKH